jgi:hypothetical protein
MNSSVQWGERGRNPVPEGKGVEQNASSQAIFPVSSKQEQDELLEWRVVKGPLARIFLCDGKYTGDGEHPWIETNTKDMNHPR